MRSSLLALAGLTALAAAPARAEHRVSVHPYIELDQTVLVDLKNGGDTVTYTSAAAGVQAIIVTRRTELSADYRYEHRFGWGKNASDEDVHSGLVRGRTWLAPNLLQLEGGLLATRARSDFRGAAPNPFVGDPDNVTQLYSAYLGPTLATHAGDLAIGAAYRFGYTKAESKARGAFAPGQPQLDAFDDATSHVATASVGMRTGVLPFAWTVSGGYEREDASQLDQRFTQASVRADVTVPVSPTVAVVGGVGYEKIRASQRDALRDASGFPVTDSDGRFVTDPASPRLLAYDQDGLIWDVGVVWRPSKRTFLEARVGRRYGSMTYIGSFSYQPSDDWALQVGVYDGVQTFGRQLNASLAGLPTQFTLARNPFGTGSCAFGASGAGAGGCLDPVLQSIATGTYRARGVNGVWRYGRGPLSAGIGLGYAQRKFFAPVGALAFTNGLKDQSWYAQAYAGYALDERSGVEGSAYFDIYDPGAAGAGNVTGAGATGSYYITFNRRLTGTASLGLFATEVDGLQSSLIGSALLGARYQF